MCVLYGVGKFVFSSSATVYGDQPSPLKEDMVLKNTTDVNKMAIQYAKRNAKLNNDIVQ